MKLIVTRFYFDRDDSRNCDLKLGPSYTPDLGPEPELSHFIRVALSFCALQPSQALLKQGLMVDHSEARNSITTSKAMCSDLALTRPLAEHSSGIPHLDDSGIPRAETAHHGVDGSREDRHESGADYDVPRDREGGPLSHVRVTGIAAMMCSDRRYHADERGRAAA